MKMNGKNSARRRKGGKLTIRRKHQGGKNDIQGGFIV
jgi:hypothetical protein